MRITLISLLLALSVSACLCTSACAAETEPAGDQGENSAAPASAAGFTDVDPSAWYADAVDYVSRQGYMVGTGGRQFSPDQTFTRAQMVTVLYRLAGEPAIAGADDFIDTTEGSWYSDAVIWASREGIAEGYGDGRFGTDDPVTQEQLVTLLWRQAGKPEGDPSASAEDASAYAKDAVRWARTELLDANSIMLPRETARRSLVAVLTARYDQRQSGTAREEAEDMGLSMKINGTDIAVHWEDNPSADALRELVREKPLVIPMSGYGGFEQVGSLGTSLPRNDVQTTTSPGDIVLYSGSNLVLFYGSNSWAYTRLGRIEGMSSQELTELLGNGDVTVTLSMA